MDSRKKPRPGGGKPSEQPKGPPAKHRPSGKGRPQRRPAQSQRQRQDAQRSARDPQQEARSREQQERRRREEARAAGNAARRHQAAARDTGEVVFKMNRDDGNDRHTPRDMVSEKHLQQRRRSASRARERAKQARRPSRAPKVVYTQPKPFNAHRLLLQLGIVMAVVMAVMLGLSVFFKVDKVMVYGNKAYSAWTIQEASGIESGERLLNINNAKASSKIKMALPYVDQVRIGINLPDTVNIYITEYDVAYSIQSQDGTWWLITSDGRVVEQTNGGTAGDYTKILGVVLDAPVVGEQAVAHQEIQVQTETDDGEFTIEAPVTVTAAEQLNAALTILESLEANDLVGEAASVDVTTISDIELMYGTRYKVRLGDINQMDYKISCVKSAVAQLGEYETGILDVSFTTWTEGAFYTPYE